MHGVCAAVLGTRTMIIAGWNIKVVGSAHDTYTLHTIANEHLSTSYRSQFASPEKCRLTFSYGHCS